MDHPFRNAMFGGFNRQDVLTYLENQAKETERQQQELQQQLDGAQETINQQNARLAAQQAELERLEEESRTLRTKLDASDRALSDTQNRCTQQSTQLESALREAGALKETVAELQPNADAYIAVKDRTAGVELEAHRRAQEVQEKAERQAKQLRHQMELWLQRVQGEYDTLRIDMERTLSHASEQISQAEKKLEQTTAMLESQRVELNSIGKSYTEEKQDEAQ